MRILIVDDDVTFLQQLRKYLLAKNLYVDVAEGGRRALEMMKNERYDIIILDLKMPDLSGVDVMRKARQHGIQSKFIIVTGYGEIETAVETMKLGAADYIQKPFDAEELFDIIKDIGSGVQENIPRDNPAEWLRRICDGKEILLVTDVKPEKFERVYGISASRSIWLEDKPHRDSRGRTKLEILVDAVNNFMNEHKNGGVIHGGISHLAKIYGRDEVQKYFSYLYKEAKERDFQVVIFYNSPEEKHILQSMQEMPFSLNVEEIAKVFRSSTRCSVIQLLDKYKSLRYTDILRKINIEASSDLAFHIRKLIEWDAIKKDSENYELTLRGHYFAELLRMFMEGQYRDPKNNIFYYPL